MKDAREEIYKDYPKVKDYEKEPSLLFIGIFVLVVVMTLGIFLL